MMLAIAAGRRIFDMVTVLWISVMVALCIVTSPVMAQETSLKPGVNIKYDNPNIERMTRSLESENRQIFKHRKEIMAVLELKPGNDVADVGAGTGFFSRMIAEEVGPEGTVYAVELAGNFVENLKRIAKEQSLANLKPVQCDERSTRLEPDSVDIVLICDTYHHFEFPYHVLDSIRQALRPDGKLVIVDYERIKGITSKGQYEHVRCGKGTVTDEVKDAGFEFVKEVPLMKEQWIRTFKKRR